MGNISIFNSAKSSGDNDMFATIYFSLENIRDKSIFASFSDLYIFVYKFFHFFMVDLC